MARSHFRPICHQFYPGVQDRIHRESTTSTPVRGRCTFSFKREHESSGRGSSITTCKRSHRDCIKPHSRLLLTSFHCPQERGGGETSSDKSKTLERLRRQEVIPYDYPKIGDSSNKKGRLVDHDRSKGRLFTHTCTHGLETLPPLHMAVEDLPVLPAPLRADVVPAGIHRHHSTVDGGVSFAGHQNNLLLRRYSAVGFIPKGSRQAERYSVGSPGAGGTPSKPSKVPSDPIPNFPIPGVGLGHWR